MSVRYGPWTRNDMEMVPVLRFPACHAQVRRPCGDYAEKRFQRFVGLDESDFVYPEDRGADYRIIDISMFVGRSDAAKRVLVSELFARIESAAGISPRSVEITITETPKVNWGIRGLNAEDLPLGYKVGV